jgi:hypothetical protein
MLVIAFAVGQGATLNLVVTQSVADPEALSGQADVLPSLTDNLSGVVAHRQTAPESRTGSRS